MRIANTLASYFMDENLKVREAQAVGTSEFLDAELEKTQKRLEEKEQKLAAFRTPICRQDAKMVTSIGRLV